MMLLAVGLVLIGLVTFLAIIGSDPVLEKEPKVSIKSVKSSLLTIEEVKKATKYLKQQRLKSTLKVVTKQDKKGEKNVKTPKSKGNKTRKRSS